MTVITMNSMSQWGDFFMLFSPAAVGRTPLLTLAMTWYALRDRIGV